MHADLRTVPCENVSRNDRLLFSETQSRFIATVSPQNVGKFEKALKGVVFARIGEVRSDGEFVLIGLAGNETVHSNVAALKTAWKRTLNW